VKKKIFELPPPILPLKINGWNIIPWRFGSDDFPFFSWVMAVLGCPRKLVNG